MRRCIYLAGIAISCLAACANDEAKNAIFGVTDFDTVNDPVCIWVNDEPVFHLYEQSSYPRISNTYPIKKGLNLVMIESLNKSAPLSVESFKPYVFYSDGKNETEIKLSKTPRKDALNGSFEADNNYGVGEGRKILKVSKDDEKLIRIWVAGYLKSLKEKNKNDFMSLFVDRIKAEELYKDAGDFFREDFKLVSMVEPENLYSSRGNSIVYIYGLMRLAVWSESENSTRSIDGFMFASSNNGLLLRVSGGEWVVIKSRK